MPAEDDDDLGQYVHAAGNHPDHQPGFCVVKTQHQPAKKDRSQDIITQHRRGPGGLLDQLGAFMLDDEQAEDS